MKIIFQNFGGEGLAPPKLAGGKSCLASVDDLALAVDNALKFKFTEIDSLLNRYEKIIDIDIVLVKTEMRMISTPLPQNCTFEDLSKLILKIFISKLF